MEKRVDIYQPSPEVRKFSEEHMSPEAIQLSVLEDLIQLYPYPDTKRSLASLHTERLWILMKRRVRSMRAAVKAKRDCSRAK